MNRRRRVEIGGERSGGRKAKKRRDDRRRREEHASVTPQPAEFSQLQGDAKEKFTKQLLFGWPGSLESLEEAETGFIVPPSHCVSLHKSQKGV